MKEFPNNGYIKKLEHLNDLKESLIFPQKQNINGNQKLQRKQKLYKKIMQKYEARFPFLAIG